ncbi:hypothetical protein [Altererythrobacter sp. ZODW24]|uniref:hypothetical protein n=1 Tax=Altererythrobacter sp. ZODW24 TaxID=2185142 RepID=UPI000DF756F1|nr:hypothetical protein [Altererythrobacter sp. ZODW24]
MRYLFILPILALAACEQAAEPEEVLSTPASIDLAGDYRVAGIDGAPFDENYGIALSVNESRIWWKPTCAGQGVDYKIYGDTFKTIDPPPPEEPRAVCDIGYPDRLPEVWQALENSDTIERTPENGIRIFGGQRSVTLFSQ